MAGKHKRLAKMKQAAPRDEKAKKAQQKFRRAERRWTQKLRRIRQR